MAVHRTDEAGCVAVVLGLLQAMAARRVAASERESLAGIRDTIRRSNIELVSQSGSGFASLYECDAGVTDARAGIAETGSLVCVAGPGRGRGLSLVPPVHIAVLWASDLVADLIDVWAPRGPIGIAASSSTVLITGPSKTADIEGVLITGVHGPREVHIVLIEGA
jgi:L-lactate utilization protein LutC